MSLRRPYGEAFLNALHWRRARAAKPILNKWKTTGVFKFAVRYYCPIPPWPKNSGRPPCFRGSEELIFKDSGLNNHQGYGFLGPKTSNIGYLDPLGLP